MSSVRGYSDLASAGAPLAEALAAYRGRPEVVVLGLARGGVPAAVEVARHLGAALDVLLLRRLIVPRGPEAPGSVFNVAGTRVMNEAVAEPQTPEMLVYLAEALAEFGLREHGCRGTRPPLALEGRTVILVDNGVRTGGTLRMSIHALRALRPARVIVAVPFAAAWTRPGLEAAADEVVCLEWHDWAGTVARGYRRFEVPDYDRIGEMLGDPAAASG